MQGKSEQMTFKQYRMFLNMILIIFCQKVLLINVVFNACTLKCCYVLKKNPGRNAIPRKRITW